MQIKYFLFTILCCFLFRINAQINSSNLPSLSNQERDNLTQLYDGMLIYNSTTHCINYYGGGLWRELCGKCAAPPAQPSIIEIKSFYNSLTIKLKPDNYMHQFALMPSFTLLPDTASTKVIIRDINATFEQIMLLNVNDCGSSQPLILDNVKFAEKNPCGENPILTDMRDGNEYRTYALGDQCWMTTNLRYGKADDKEIFLETDKLRKLYTWDFGEVKMNPKTGKFETLPINENVCPDGWHVPTEKDIDEMLAFYHNYGSNTLFRNVFKSDDNAHFYNMIEKIYEPLDEKLIFWTATNAQYDDAKCVLLIQGNEIIKHFLSPQVAIPIRCLKNK